jgi:hypothetical protein
MKKATVVRVTQDEEKPIATEVLAQEIMSISQGIRRLLNGPMNRKALVLLIKHASPAMGQYPARHVGIAEVKAVLEGIESLEATYLKPKRP